MFIPLNAFLNLMHFFLDEILKEILQAQFHDVCIGLRDSIVLLLKFLEC
jgi:hypothetical protein